MSIPVPEFLSLFSPFWISIVMEIVLRDTNREKKKKYSISFLRIIFSTLSSAIPHPHFFIIFFISHFIFRFPPESCRLAHHRFSPPFGPLDQSYDHQGQPPTMHKPRSTERNKAFVALIGRNRFVLLGKCNDK